MLKKKQHYVWRHYLKQWTINEKIFCHRDGVIFDSGLMGVAQRRYFYKLNELSKQDVDVIYKIAIEPTYKHLQEINKNWVSLFNYIFEIKELYEKSNIDSQEIDKIIHEAIHNFEEDIHTNIENGAISHLSSILNKNISFYNNKKDNFSRINFS